MTYSTFEESRTKGAPIWLYRFYYGNREYCYTSFERDVDHDSAASGTYTSKTIKHESPKSSGSLDKSTLRVTAQRDLLIRDLFLIWPPSAVVNLAIRNGHDGDPDEDFKICWAGRVLTFERTGSEAVMTCQPISTSMRQPGLRFPYSIMCAHWLYGPECQASRPAATTTATVTATSGATITIAAGWNGVHPIDRYQQGDVRWTNDAGEEEIRTIMSVDTTVIRLSGALIDMHVGTVVSIALGCNHKTAPVGDLTGDCVNLHNNGPNYGGCKWIPLKNPVAKNNFR